MKLTLNSTGETLFVDFQRGRDIDGNKTSYTRCTIHLHEPEEDVLLGWGESRCHPNDAFDHRKGKIIALTDALFKLWLTREARTEIWQAFFDWIEIHGRQNQEKKNA